MYEQMRVAINPDRPTSENSCTCSKCPVRQTKAKQSDRHRDRIGDFVKMNFPNVLPDLFKEARAPAWMSEAALSSHDNVYGYKNCRT